MSQMSTTFSLIKEYFEEAEVSYFVQDADEGLIGTVVTAENGNYKIMVHLQEERDTILFIAPYYIKIPLNHENRDQILRFLMTINYRLLLGKFSYDLFDGEVQFQIAIPLNDAKLTLEQFKRALYTIVYTLDDYYPTLMKMLYAGMTAIEAIENDEPQDTRTQLSQLLSEAEDMEMPDDDPDEEALLDQIFSDEKMDEFSGNEENGESE